MLTPAFKAEQAFIIFYSAKELNVRQLCISMTCVSAIKSPRRWPGVKYNCSVGNLSMIANIIAHRDVCCYNENTPPPLGWIEVLLREPVSGR